MAETPESNGPGTPMNEETDTADTIDMENEPIMRTSEFRALIELETELFGDAEDDNER